MVYDERLQGVPMETIPLQGFDKSYSYQFEWISREERLFYAKLNRLAKNMINFEQNDIRIQKKNKNEHTILSINHVNFASNMIATREEILTGYIVYKITRSAFYSSTTVWTNEALYKSKRHFGIEYNSVHFW